MTEPRLGGGLSPGMLGEPSPPSSGLGPVPLSVRPVSEYEAGFRGRLARLMALRLFVLTLFLGFVTLIYLRGQTGGFSSLVAFGTVAAAYAMAAGYAALLRSGRFLTEVAYAQILTDQLSWTAIVYVTGGATSGAVSLYGLTCFAGAVALGRRGAIFGVVTALLFYIGLTASILEGAVSVPPDQSQGLYVTTWEAAAYPMLANSIGLVLVASMSGYLAERLRVAGGDLALAEARAQAAERLAGLGRLATGLAHEIRNPLGGISGSVELLKMSPSLTEEDKRLCDIVQREASRLNDLVGDMLDIARPRLPQLGDVDAALLARDVVVLASRSGRGEDVRVLYEGPGALHLRADASQLRQVLWNLVRNAVQASSAGDEVVVRLSLGEAGDALVEVADRGPGIPVEARERIFDVFYTTRSHGTGVGLAVVKQIIDAHGWRIQVLGTEGATFRVTAPRTAVIETEA